MADAKSWYLQQQLKNICPSIQKVEKSSKQEMISISSQTFRKGRLFKTSLFLDLFKKVIHEHLKRERDFKLGDPINMMRKFSKEELKQEIQDFNIIQSCQWLKQSQLTIPLSIIRMFSCTVYRGPVSSSDHIIELCICMYIFYINFF